jgi:hypothetical protein
MTAPGSQNGTPRSVSKRKRHAGVCADMQHTRDQLNKCRKSGDGSSWPWGGSSGVIGASRG